MKNNMKIDNDIDIDNSTDNSGNNNRSIFNDRLLKIRRDRLKYAKDNDKVSDRVIVKDVSRNIFKVILALPSVIYSNVIDNSKKTKNNNIDVKDNNNGVNIYNLDERVIAVLDVDNDTLLNDIDEIRKLKVNMIKDIDISLLRKNKNIILRSFNNNSSGDDIVKDINIEIRKEKLKKEILDLIKKKLVKNVNELEILQSDLYVLKQLSNGDIYYVECKQDINEIKKLLSKVNSLKEKYNFLKDNVDFEYMLEYGDDFLIDKILELKEICLNDDVKNIIDDYKILDEYKYLYLKIDKLQDNVYKYEEYRNERVEELKQRDIDFDKMKNDLYNIDVEREKYEDFVKRQENLLKELNEKITKIDSYEMVTYRLNGFNQLLGNSFKYLGLLLVNPLKGIIPAIAVQTVVTKNMVKKLYNNLEWSEDRKLVYEGIDYSISINMMISDLDNMSLMINSTLEDILLLKNKYVKEFSQYESSFSGYKDVIRKLNKIENAVLGSKMKIEMMQEKMIEKERENDNKLKMIKKLNTRDE